MIYYLLFSFAFLFLFVFSVFSNRRVVERADPSHDFVTIRAFGCIATFLLDYHNPIKITDTDFWAKKSPTQMAF